MLGTNRFAFGEDPNSFVDPAWIIFQDLADRLNKATFCSVSRQVD